MIVVIAIGSIGNRSARIFHAISISRVRHCSSYDYLVEHSYLFGLLKFSVFFFSPTASGDSELCTVASSSFSRVLFSFSRVPMTDLNPAASEDNRSRSIARMEIALRSRARLNWISRNSRRLAFPDLKSRVDSAKRGFPPPPLPSRESRQFPIP